MGQPAEPRGEQAARLKAVDGGMYIATKTQHKSPQTCIGCAFFTPNTCMAAEVNGNFICEAGDWHVWTPHDDEAKAATAARKLRS
jgi:hypothetical protein